MIADGYPESEQSWKELLLSVKHRGLTVDPTLASATGRWASGRRGGGAAGREVWPTTDEQRRRVHKTANVLNELPRSTPSKAKRMPDLSSEARQETATGTARPNAGGAAARREGLSTYTDSDCPSCAFGACSGCAMERGVSC